MTIETIIKEFKTIPMDTPVLEDFLRRKLSDFEKAIREETAKEQKANIEQAMVHLYRKLPEFIVKKPRYMSKAKKDSLWGHMCMWIDEYLEKLKDKKS